MLVEIKMFKILFFFAFFQLCFCQCPNGTESSFTNPNNCYIFVANKSEFINAEGYCRQQGGHLASVTNAFDNMFLSSKASLYFLDSTDSDFWIGGTNELTPGIWSWIDGTSFTYTDWAQGQPANATALNCAASSITTSLWSAFDCFKTKPFACMIPAPATTTTIITTTTTTKKLPPTTTTKRIPTCENGWHSFDTTGFCYLPVISAGVWQDAENYCVRNFNSHLVSIHSQLESDFVADLVRDYSRNDKESCFSNQVWIGLYTVTFGQNWIWTDGTPYNFPGWSPGEPNNEQGVENCAQLLKNDCDGDNMNYWNDQRCAFSVEYFVCKKSKS
jgi:hypothetical protein